MELKREQLLEISDAILDQMGKGLSGKKGNGGLMMLPSFVDRFPTGDEEGEYFAIDLGGTNLKVVWVKLGDRRVLDKHVKEWPIPEECYNTDNGLLMPWIVDSCIEVLNEYSTQKDRIVIGFCYSFACRQDNLDHGEQLLWTKKFKGTGLLGQDVVQILKNSFKKKGVNAIIPALMNDSVASLVGAQFMDSRVKSAVILGTGTNCSYIESVNKIHTLPKNYRKHGEYMIINTEWGDGKISDYCSCEEDQWIDLASANPGHGLFEKLISGLYIGDVVRRIIWKIAGETGLFGGPESLHNGLGRPGSFDGACLSKIYHDESAALEETKVVLETAFELKNSSMLELKTAKSICRMVARRSARLCAAAMVAILSREFENSPTGEIAISVDGSTFTKFDGYRNIVRETLDEILNDPSKSNRVQLTTADGSSVIGAAVVAAVESKYL